MNKKEAVDHLINEAVDHLINIVALSEKREFRLGTRIIDEIGVTRKYAKIDFGVAYKDKSTGKVYRHIVYGWIVVSY